MKVIKNINNNVAICLDSKEQEVVVFGKGIGFSKPPCELDLSKVQRTFYDIDPMYIQMIQNIPEEMLEIATQVIDYARSKVEYLLNSNVVFTLADHLSFAKQRYEQNMILPMPIYYDVKTLYEKEYEIGKYAVACVDERCKIHLPREEITSVALHIINAAAIGDQAKTTQGNQVFIDEIKKMIEVHFALSISEDDFNYSRFVSHVQYLLMRGKQGKSISSENFKLYASLKENFPKVHACALKINAYLYEVEKLTFDEEEILYLMLHINRLCVREDCYCDEQA